MTTLKDKINGKFQSIMALALKMDKLPRKFGTEQELSHSEIHFVEIIGDNPDSSVTEIASRLEITKGAVSQTLKKLEQKGLSQKSQDPENLSRAMVSLTAKGNMAYWAHKHWHETLDGGFAQYIETLNGSEAAIILNFLNRTEDFLKRRLRYPE